MRASTVGAHIHFVKGGCEDIDAQPSRAARTGIAGGEAEPYPGEVDPRSLPAQDRAEKTRAFESMRGWWRSRLAVCR